jgi:hypothetical protein
VAIQKKKVDPADRLDYGFDWADPKAKPRPFLAVGETISDSTWVLYDEDWNVVTDVTVDDDSGTSTETFTFFGPADDVDAIRGQVRYLTNHITTNQGREKDESYQFTFEEQ